MATVLDTIRQTLAAAEPDLRRRGVRHLALFGSIARGEASPDTDIDLAVEIEDGHPFSIIRLEETRLLLQDRLGRPVDLGEIASFRPHVRATFERDSIRIF